MNDAHKSAKVPKIKLFTLIGSVAATLSPALSCSFTLFLMMCWTGSAEHNDPVKNKTKQKKTTMISQSFFQISFFPLCSLVGIHSKRSRGRLSRLANDAAR